ncbi:uncharacterized protein LOC112177717 [Rosa chinensis]|uniref:uncharacterized protein LOC112177717 n=1 Tax=Rosa chinensis TaxID=74649 RepID=UPI000D097995|nr:uncharacterized protein LOC112177717 [Rosa chinensis]
MTSSLQMLAYGAGADQCAVYCRMTKSISITVLQQFTRGIVNLYSVEYLRAPNAVDLKRLLAKAEKRGFSGMIGSIDCYYLADSIYLRWATFLKTRSCLWDKEDNQYIMLTCIILHNMIVEDELPEDSDDELESDEEEENNMRPKISKVWEGLTGSDFDPVGRDDHYMNGSMDRYQKIRSEYTHSNLQEDLIKHFWEVKGNRRI